MVYFIFFSLVPLPVLNDSSINLSVFFCCEIFKNSLLISLRFNIELSLLPVFKLWVLNHWWWKFVASPDHHADLFESARFTIDTETSKRIWSQFLIHSLHKSIEQIVNNMKLSSLRCVELLILKVPDR